MSAMQQAKRTMRYRLVLCVRDINTDRSSLLYVDEDEPIQESVKNGMAWGVVDTHDGSRVAGGSYDEMKEKLAEVRGLPPTSLGPAMVTIYAGGGPQAKPETVSLHDGVTATDLRNYAAMLRESADLMDRTGLTVPVGNTGDNDDS